MQVGGEGGSMSVELEWGNTGSAQTQFTAAEGGASLNGNGNGQASALFMQPLA